MRRGCESWDCSMWSRERSGDVLSMCTNTWREVVKIKPGSFQRCPVTGPEAKKTNRNIAGSLQTSGNIFSQWRWLSAGTGCPGLLWSLHPWKCSKVMWTRSFAAGSRWSCLSMWFSKMNSRDRFQLWPFCYAVPRPNYFITYMYGWYNRNSDGGLWLLPADWNLV